MVYFFYPSKITGGAEFLFLRAILLLSKHNYDVGVIDIRNGWISNELSKIGFNKIVLLDEKVTLKPNDTLITTANLLYDVRNYFNSTDARIIFWVLHPYNVILNLPTKYDGKVVTSLFKKYIDIFELCNHKTNLSKLIEANSITSMDHDCDRVLKLNYDISYNQFLPIFIDFDDEIDSLCDDIAVDTQVNIAWLGRVDLDFKIHILEKFILDLEECSILYPNLIFNLNIIGTGPGLSRLRLISDTLSRVNLHFMGEAIAGSLNSCLKKINLGIAMGTSAIELAYRGIPTLLLDFSFSKIDYYKYRWFYESKNFELARDINILSIKEIQQMTDLKDIIANLVSDYQNIAQKCKQSAYVNFNGKLFLEKFHTLLLEDHLTISKVNSFRKPIYKHFTKIAKKITCKIRSN